MLRDPQPLKHLAPGWFSIVMGLSGLSLAWHGAQPLMGEMAPAVALIVGLLAAGVFVALGVAMLQRLRRHPQAWSDDLRHPVRHAFLATLPIAALLLATVAVALFGPGPAARGLWWAGALAQFGVTLWVLGRWWRPGSPTATAGPGAHGLPWASVTPALFIPIVGNVLVPLAGVPLGHADWSAAQFGVGLMLWPVVLVLLVARIAVQGIWAERLLPTGFILIAPPAVIGLSALQLGAPLVLGWVLWGMALFSLLWVGQTLKRIRDLPFGVSHWAIGFPLAALAALTLRLAEPGGGLLAVLGPGLLALASIAILMLCVATVRGLREGSLLTPEPVASIAPVGAGLPGTPRD